MNNIGALVDNLKDHKVDLAKKNKYFWFLILGPR